MVAQFDLSVLAPPPKLTISEWCEEFRSLSREDSAEPGKFRCDRAPYQVEMMNAFQGCEQTVFMTSAQVGKTSILVGILGYLIHLDPCPILLVLPTIDFCKTFSKERLAPFIRDNATVRDKVIEPRSRRSSSTLFTKLFKGGQLNLVGSNSVAGLSSRPVRVVLFDECDRFETTSEGDALSLAYKRTTTFWNRRIILTSTPSIKGVSRIEKAFNESDRRYYYVPCPHCDRYQTLVWENVVYERTAPEKAKYKCRYCNNLIVHTLLSSMLRSGKWVKHNPSSDLAGFHINELYSPWSSWGKVAAEYEKVKDDPERYQVWVNTSLGLPYEAPSQSIDPNPLQERAEQSSYSAGTVPEEVRFLTAGIDVQGDRFAVQVLGFSREHTCVIEYQEIPADPMVADSWRILNDYLTSLYPKTDGSTLKIRASFIDSGYLTEEVYNATRKLARLYACKGVSGDKPILQPRSRPIDASYKGKPIPGGIRLHLIGVDAAKTLIYNRLKLEPEQNNAILFPNDLDPSYFDQLTNEHQVLRRKMGANVLVWEKVDLHAAVEVLDTFVYAIAAAYLLGLPRIKWDKWEKPAPEELKKLRAEETVHPNNQKEAVMQDNKPNTHNIPKKQKYIKRFNNWLNL